MMLRWANSQQQIAARNRWEARAGEDAAVYRSVAAERNLVDDARGLDLPLCFATFVFMTSQLARCNSSACGGDS